MHEFQHVVSGDHAFESLTQALQLAAGDAVNMADDLAVGRLGDVDAESSPLRAAFWRQVFGPQAPAFEAEHGGFELRLAEVARAFRALPSDPRPCLVWHGNGATERLTLDRACHFLDGSAREIWSIEILPEDQRPLPLNWLTGVGMLRPAELARLFTRRRRLPAGERTRHAEEWRGLVRSGNAETLRHPLPDRIETRPISTYDDRILAEATDVWQETKRVVGDAMVHSEDAFIGDAFIFWRIREMARAGRLELEPFAAGMRDSRVRLAS
jgi:hypothetical protein